MGRQKLDYNKMTNEEILQLFKEQYFKIKPKDYPEYKEKTGDIPSLYILRSRLGLNWNDALKNIGVYKVKYDRDSYINAKNIFLNITEQIGDIPSVDKLRKYCEEQEITDITGILIKRYGSYNKFLKAMGENYNKTPVKVKENNQELLKMYIDFSKKIGRPATSQDLNNNDEVYNASVFSIRFGGINNLRKMAGYKERKWSNKKYTKTNLIKVLKEKYIIYKRRLTVEEIRNDKDIPNPIIFLNYFKTTSFDEIWNRVEKTLIQDYIKLLNEI